ncbi:hypothetical protein WDW86_14505 [Bdellovibrionota bacterium FG-2]
MKSKGFSLIGIMVLMAVSSVVLLALTSLKSNMLKTVTNSRLSADWSDLDQRIRLRLKFPDGCSSLLAGTTPLTAGWKPTTSAGTQSLNTEGIVVDPGSSALKLNSLYRPGLVISDVQLNWAANPLQKDGSYLAKLLITAQKGAGSGVGSMILSQSYDLYLIPGDTDMSNTCSPVQTEVSPYVIIAQDAQADCPATIANDIQKCFDSPKLKRGGTAFIRQQTYLGDTSSPTWMTVPANVHVIGENGTVLKGLVLQLSNQVVVENITFDQAYVLIKGNNILITKSMFRRTDSSGSIFTGISQTDDTYSNLRIIENSFGDEASPYTAKASVLTSLSVKADSLEIVGNRYIFSLVAPGGGYTDPTAIALALGAGSPKIRVAQNYIWGAATGIKIVATTGSSATLNMSENKILSAGGPNTGGGAQGILCKLSGSQVQISNNQIWCNNFSQNLTSGTVQQAGIEVVPIASGVSSIVEVDKNTVSNCHAGIKTFMPAVVTDNLIDFYNIVGKTMYNEAGIVAVGGVVSRNQISRAGTGIYLPGAANRSMMVTANQIMNQASGSFAAATDTNGYQCPMVGTETTAICVGNVGSPVIISHNSMSGYKNGIYVKRLMTDPVGDVRVDWNLMDSSVINLYPFALSNNPYSNATDL